MKKTVRRRLYGVLLGTLLIISGFSGCGRQQDVENAKTAEDAGKLNVVTTLFPYYDFTRQLAGDDVALTMVIPAGMDSHSFEPTPADVVMIQNADVLICNGGEMEQWLSKVLEAVDTSKMTVVSMMDYVDAMEEEHVEGMEDAAHTHEEPEDGHEEDIEYDEHIWTSPVNAMKIVRVISDTLQQADPEHQTDYTANTDSYLEQLKELHQEFLDVAEHKKRNMIVVGNKFPFRYLAEEYGFKYRAAFSGCSTDTEPSAKTIAYLIDKVKEEHIPVVYYLELSSSRVAEIIGEETGAVPLLLHSCHNVTRAQFESGITYLELMKTNVENLRKGLVE